jgi:hypothetical protein
MGLGWVFEPWRKSESLPGCTVHQPSPLNQFSHFSKTEPSL